MDRKTESFYKEFLKSVKGFAAEIALSVSLLFGMPGCEIPTPEPVPEYLRWPGGVVEDKYFTNTIIIHTEPEGAKIFIGDDHQYMGISPVRITRKYMVRRYTNRWIMLRDFLYDTTHVYAPQKNGDVYWRWKPSSFRSGIVSVTAVKEGYRKARKDIQFDKQSYICKTLETGSYPYSWTKEITILMEKYGTNRTKIEIIIP